MMGGPEPVVPGPDDECPGAEVVNTTTGTGSKQSPVFAIEGNSFRITTTVEPVSQDPSLAGVSAVVNTEDDDLVTIFSKEGAGTESSVVNEGPGRFFLGFNAANANYAVVVEDCVGAADNGGDGNDGDDGDADDGVIDDTIPDKDLPDTGGSTALMVGGSAILLLYGGLVAWRLKTRER